MDLSKVVDDEDRKSSPLAGPPSARRAKRAKYTAVACDECKKRKLKCIPAPGKQACERCIASGSQSVCVFAPGPSQVTKDKEKTDKEQIKLLTEDLHVLREQVLQLSDAVREMKTTRVSTPVARSTGSYHAATHHSDSRSPVSHVPKEPQFVGPTRSAFSFIIGEKSLTRMGIPTFDDADATPPDTTESAGKDSRRSPSVKEFRHGHVSQMSPTSELEFWDRCTPSELARLLAVFQEEVESVYPFIVIRELVAKSEEILDCLDELMRGGRPRQFEQAQRGHGGRQSRATVSPKDIEIVKVAVATALVVEAQGKTPVSTSMVESVERNASRISRPEVSLKEVQLMTMLSTYYYHSDDELLSWRAIGVAARESLEMGLHRKKSLFQNFPDADERRLAVRAFWCVHVLDRRWSFGTSLPFALDERDIDPELPMPDHDFAYLRCMVGYGRLCSKLWEAIPPYGSMSQSIPDEVVLCLDRATAEWIGSLPPNLQFRHSGLGQGAGQDNRITQRLRALLYLRANHIRILIYRHYLLSVASIKADVRSSWHVVEVAQDTISVLVHLHATTDIYTRQQNVFNYFLLSALAVVFLAVCHAPGVFAAHCRKTFLSAVDLVRGFSRDSTISRRLWESIRGLLPRLKRLGIVEDSTADDSLLQNLPVHQAGDQPLTPVQLSQPTPSYSPQPPDHGLDTAAMPDMYQMRNELLTIFDAFGQGYVQAEGDNSNNLQRGGFVPLTDEGGNGDYRADAQGYVEGWGDWDFSKRFQELI